MTDLHTQDSYLWDPGNLPDAEIERLERLLSRYRMVSPRPLRLAGISPDTRPPGSRIRGASRSVGIAIVLTAAALLIAAAVVRWRGSEARPWQVTARGGVQVDGAPTIDTVLRLGQWLVTAPGSEAHIRIGEIGFVQLRADSALSLIEDSGHKRMFLRYGVLHAKISANPGVFIVETPFTRATDLGCEYDLRVDRNGSGFLQVAAGWVALEYMQRQSLVPQGAVATIGGPGLITPAYFPDATVGFKDALRTYAFTPTGDATRRAALDVLVRDARLMDAYTLINLFRLSDQDERTRIFARLNELVPAPSTVSRDALIDGDLMPLNAWWPVVLDKLGLLQIRKTAALNLGEYSGHDK